MPAFIVDTCTDTIDGQKGYISAFFRDVKSLNGFNIVIGGTKMETEIKGKLALFSLVSQLKKAGRVIVLNGDSVDQKAVAISERVVDKLGAIPPSCDDFHLLAVSLISGCRNLITSEQRLRECIDSIRDGVGHQFCPKIRLIRDEQTYLSLKNSGKL
jgi:hypothetical protein